MRRGNRVQKLGKDGIASVDVWCLCRWTGERGDGRPEELWGFILTYGPCGTITAWDEAQRGRFGVLSKPHLWLAFPRSVVASQAAHGYPARPPPSPKP